MATTTAKTTVANTAYTQIATGPCNIQVQRGTIRLQVAGSQPAVDDADFFTLSQSKVPVPFLAVAADKVWARSDVEDSADVVALSA